MRFSHKKAIFKTILSVHPPCKVLQKKRKMDPDITKSTRLGVKASVSRGAVLFTDIVGSTSIWAKEGDQNARMIIDHHNQLIFPLVRQFNGKVLKTIGDSVMAYFRKPQLAVQAAVAMQQILAAERRNAEYFPVHIRIGVHAGPMIVEKSDAYGDVVNVAARIESRCKADQILISGDLRRSLKGEWKSRKWFKRAGSFVPKGVAKKMDVYEVHWSRAPQTEVSPKNEWAQSIGRLDKKLILAGLAGLVFSGIWVFSRYISILLGAILPAEMASVFLHPVMVLQKYPGPVFLLLLVPVVLLWRSVRQRNLVILSLKVSTGGLYAGVMSLMVWLMLAGTQKFFPEAMENPLWKSDRLFVQVVGDSLHVIPLAESLAGQSAFAEESLPEKKARKRHLPENSYWLFLESSGAGRNLQSKIQLIPGSTAWVPRIDRGGNRNTLGVYPWFTVWEILTIPLVLLAFLTGFHRARLRAL